MEELGLYSESNFSIGTKDSRRTREPVRYVKIKDKDLDYKADNGLEEMKKYGFTNTAYYQIFRFYKTHENRYNIGYSLDDAGGIASVIDTTAIPLYARYGIVSDCTKSVSQSDICAIAVLDESDLSSFSAMLKKLCSFALSRCDPLTTIDLNNDNPEQFAGSIGAIVINMTKEEQLAWMSITESSDDYQKIIDYISSPVFTVFNLFIPVNGAQKMSSISFSKNSEINRVKGMKRRDGSSLFKFVDIDRMVKEFGCGNRISYSAAMDGIYKLIDWMVDIGKNKNDVMFYSLACAAFDTTICTCTDANAKVVNQEVNELVGFISLVSYKNFIVRLACYLRIKHEIILSVPDCLRDDFSATFRQLSSREYNYCEDYINFLCNLPAITVRYGYDLACYYVLDKQAIDNDKSGEQYALYAKITYVQLEHGYEELQHFTAKLKTLDIVPFNSVFNLATKDYESASRIDYEIIHKKLRYLIVTTMHNSFIPGVNDIILFRKDGAICAGVVDEFMGKLPFIVCPMINGNPAFKKELSVNQLWYLEDIRSDAFYKLREQYYNKVLGNTTNIVKAKDLFWKYPRTVEGILVEAPVLKLDTLSCKSDQKFFDYDTVGLYHSQTANFRGVKISALTNLIPINGLYKYFVSFFGGKHPYNGNEVRLTTDYWR